MVQQKREDQQYFNHIDFLRDNFPILVDYRTKTGKSNHLFELVQKDLFDKDPFIVYGASVIATLAFADRTLYH